MILCLTIHEYAHAMVAYWLGDQTASEQGRFTLSPISHIDPIGTLLVPIMMLSTGGAYFGWARPVPYNPARFDRKFTMRTGAMLVALAGPASNFLFAIVCTVLYAMAFRFGYVQQLGPPGRALIETLIQVNVGLGVFNLLPVAPLDGSKVLSGLLPEKQSRAYDDLMARGGFLMFMVVVLVAGPVMRAPVVWVLSFLLRVMLPGLAGA